MCRTPSNAPPRFAGTGFEVLSGLDVGVRYVSRSFAVTEWHCREPRHRPSTGKHQPWHVLAFVHGGTFRLDGPRGRGVVDPAVQAIFRPGEEYTTSHPGGCGDYGSAIALSTAAAADLDATLEREGHGDPWRHALRPAAAPVLASQLELLRRLRRDPVTATHGDAGIDETLFRLAASALRAPGVRAGATARAMRERVAAAQEILELRFAEALRLEELARAVELSPFQLCREFRRQTGWTVHRYRTQLRLVHSLDRLAREPRRRLVDLALDLGFDGHSHFADVFRRWVGRTPSAFRSAAGPPR